MTSGRIADFGVNPCNPEEYYVAVTSGHVLKILNAGIIWKPVFDNYCSYSIGVVIMDPNNHNVVCAGTGENNHQRALGYGNGVFKSMDGGKSFEIMGLKDELQTVLEKLKILNTEIIALNEELYNLGAPWTPGRIPIWK
jgi:photosystem II stability/assembly factor-like uncharacterized protein